MPAVPEGVYRDRTRGTWYFKATLGRDATAGRRAQVTRRGFHTAAEAAKARRELLAKVDAGEVRANRSALTVAALLDEYLDGLDADRRLSARTRFDHRARVEAHVRPHLGSFRIQDLTPEVLLGWQRTLAHGDGQGRGLAPNTIRLVRQPLKGVLDLAVKRGLMIRSPLEEVPHPHIPRSIPKHWSPEQAREFLALMEGDRTWPIWAFLLGTGLRVGEVVWLRWPCVDLERGELAVVEFVSRVGTRLEPSRGKSINAVRTVALDSSLISVLGEQQKVQVADRERAEEKYFESDFVFTQSRGGPYHPVHLSKLVARYSDEVGLPRLSAHGLRHTAATLMLASGVPPKVAAERLGHANSVLFSNLYAHVTPSMQRDAAEAVGRVLFG
ncbi:MAG: site-specific integrase [Acidimicrobiales bacterium]|jgi:integrase